MAKKTWKFAVYALLCVALVVLSACGADGEKAASNGASGDVDKKFKIVIMPKLVGIDYYNAVKKGVDQAAEELKDKVEVEWMGPTDAQVEKQIEMLETVIPSKPDVIAIAANDPDAIVPVLKKAADAGIKVVTWDGDANFRDFFINLVDYDQFGAAIMDDLAEQIGKKGDIAIITTSFTAPNQVKWIAAIEKTIKDKYPDIKILDTRPAGEDTQKANQIAQDLIKTMPTLKGIIALGAPNLPGAADAVKAAGKQNEIAVAGNSLPNMMEGYLKEDVLKKVHLWNAPDHGYLTIYSAYELLTNGLTADKVFTAGTMGSFTPIKDEVSTHINLPILAYDKTNVEQYDF